MIDLTPIVHGVIIVVSLVATAFLIPYLKSKSTAAQHQELQTWINLAVLAAEQLFGSAQGEQKKQWVLEQLAKRNLTLDLDAVGIMIEAEVRKLFNWDK